MQTMEQLSECGDLVDNLLDYIEQAVLMKFAANNHFSYAFLADLFQVSHSFFCYTSLSHSIYCLTRFTLCRIAYRTKAKNSVIHVHQRG